MVKKTQGKTAEPVSPVAAVRTFSPVPVVGFLCSGSRPGALLVDFVGSTQGPQTARTAVALTEQEIVAALNSKQGVVLIFEQGDPRRPIVLALLQPDEGGALLATLLAAPVAQSTGKMPRKNETEVHVDGKRVIIEGKDEVVLKCGQASITLRRDGRVVVKGRHVETRADTVNRIKGGSVKIN